MVTMLRRHKILATVLLILVVLVGSDFLLFLHRKAAAEKKITNAVERFSIQEKPIFLKRDSKCGSNPVKFGVTVNCTSTAVVFFNASKDREDTADDLVAMASELGWKGKGSTLSWFRSHDDCCAGLPHESDESSLLDIIRLRDKERYELGLDSPYVSQGNTYGFSINLGYWPSILHWIVHTI